MAFNRLFAGSCELVFSLGVEDSAQSGHCHERKKNNYQIVKCHFVE